jgi:hypothetical protein
MNRDGAQCAWIWKQRLIRQHDNIAVGTRLDQSSLPSPLRVSRDSFTSWQKKSYMRTSQRSALKLMHGRHQWQ